MRTLWTALYVLACIGLSVLFVSCFSSARLRAGDNLGQVVNAAMTDGIVTAQEAAVIQDKLDDVRNAPTFDWVETVGTVIGSVGATLGVLRAIPNQHIIGKAESAAVNKVAGI